MKKKKAQAQKPFEFPFVAPDDQEPSNSEGDNFDLPSGSLSSLGSDDGPHDEDENFVDDVLKLVSVIEQASSVAVDLVSEQERIASLEGDELEEAAALLAQRKKNLVQSFSGTSEVESFSSEVAPLSKVRHLIVHLFDVKEAHEELKKEIVMLKRSLANPQGSKTVITSVANERKLLTFNCWNKNQIFKPLPDHFVFDSFILQLSEEARVVLTSFGPELQERSTNLKLIESISTLDQFTLQQLNSEARCDFWRQLIPPPIVQNLASASANNSASHVARMVEVPIATSHSHYDDFVKSMGGPQIFAGCNGSLTPPILIAFEGYVAEKTSRSRISISSILCHTADNFASCSGLTVYQGQVQHLLPKKALVPVDTSSEENQAMILDFSSNAPKTVIANVASSSNLTRLATLPSSQSDFINSVYGKTGGFPTKVAQALRFTSSLAAGRLKSGKSAFTSEFLQEVQVVHNNQLVLLAAVDLLCQALAQHADAPWAIAIADLIRNHSLAKDAPEAGMTTTLSAGLRARDLDLNMGQRALIVLKKGSEANAPALTVSLLREFYSSAYSGQGALNYANEFVNLLHKTKESIVAPPGKLSHGAIGEPECLDLLLGQLLDGYSDPSFQHGSQELKVIQRISELHKDQTLNSLDELMILLTKSTSDKSLASTSKRRDHKSKNDFALSVSRSQDKHKPAQRGQDKPKPVFAKLTNQEYVHASTVVGSIFRKHFESSGSGASLSDYFDHVHLHNHTVLRWKKNKIDKSEIASIFPNPLDRKMFWAMVHSVESSSSQFHYEVVNASVKGAKSSTPSSPSFGGGGGGSRAGGGFQTAKEAEAVHMASKSKKKKKKNDVQKVAVALAPESPPQRKGNQKKKTSREDLQQRLDALEVEMSKSKKESSQSHTQSVPSDAFDSPRFREILDEAIRAQQHQRSFAAAAEAPPLPPPSLPPPMVPFMPPSNGFGVHGGFGFGHPGYGYNNGYAPNFGGGGGYN